MIQNLTCRVLFLKILFQAYKLFIQIPVDFIRFFFNVRFSNRKSQSHQKLLKKDHSFYNTVSLKKLHSFYESQLTWHCKQYVPAIQLKSFLFLQIFQITYFCLVSEITFAQHNFLMPKNRILDVLKAARCSGLT